MLQKKFMLNQFSRGRLNQAQGKKFEGAIRLFGALEGLLVIENGVKARKSQHKIVLQKSNVDFLILGSRFAGEICFCDAKSFQGRRFGQSQLNPRQIAMCEQYAQRGFPAGFVVYLREANFVGFYESALFRGSKERRGFGIEDGVALGTLQSFSLRRIWEGCPPPQR